jgi:Tfp pilus assembly protein PilF
MIMRNFNLKLFAVLIMSAFLFSGCGLGKMIKKYNTVEIKATPEVLETHGGKITVSINGTIPPKYFHRKASVTITPTVKSTSGTEIAKFKSITLKGEKATGDGQTIGYKSGGSFTYTDVIEYNPSMNASELMIQPLANLKKKTNVSISQKDVKLSDGVIYTSERVERDEDLQIAAHGYELETIITEAANLFFEYNKSNLNNNLALNKDQAAADRRAAIEEFLKKNWKVKSIDILAWASPEGELTLNKKLSDDRGKTGNTWLNDLLKKMIKAKTLTNVTKPEEVPVNLVSKGEDYDGFMKALNASSLPQKQTIANVINSQDNKLAREKAIKDMTVIYAEIENMLSVLRRSEILVNCYEPKKTREEIIQLSTTNPEKLDNKELLYSATLTEDMNTKYQIYKSATTIYPQDWKSFNNAGVAAMELGKLDEAANYLEKAKALKAGDPQVLYNLGVLAFWKKDYATSEKYFNEAKAGVDVTYSNGVMKIRQGDYAGALSAFGSKKCKYNIALAQLLNGNAAAAKQTLECTKPQTAAVYYLMAVVGARSGNTSAIYENLRKAIQADAKYREQAKEDREFLKYFNEAAFQDAVR